MKLLRAPPIAQVVQNTVFIYFKEFLFLCLTQGENLPRVNHRVQLLFQIVKKSLFYSFLTSMLAHHIFLLACLVILIASFDKKLRA